MVKILINTINNNYKFYSLLIVEIAFLTYLNWQNNIMSGILPSYENYVTFFKSGFDLKSPFLNNNYTFPMWGYALILLVFNKKIIIVLFQQLLSLFLVWYLDKNVSKLLILENPTLSRIVYRILILTGFSWHLFHVPLWPYGVSAICITLSIAFYLRYLKLPNLIYLTGSALLFGLALNLRSDYLYFTICFYLIVLLYYLFKRNIKLLPLNLWLAIVGLIMLPWMIYTKAKTGHILLNSTNGGHVLFIGLGQLPDNPWHITPYDGDSTMHAILKQKFGEGVNSLSYTADNFLKEAWQERIADQPKYYFKRCVINIRDYFLRPFTLGQMQTKIGNYDQNWNFHSIHAELTSNSLRANINLLFIVFIQLVVRITGIIFIFSFWFIIISNIKLFLGLFSKIEFTILFGLILYQIALLIFAFYNSSYHTNIYIIYVLCALVLIDNITPIKIKNQICQEIIYQK